MDLDDAQTGVQMRAPRRLFYPDRQPIQLNWIAEGTDGKLYVVPAEAGGWLRRSDYRGPGDGLSPVSLEKARTIAWYVYGDVGTVTIAQA